MALLKALSWAVVAVDVSWGWVTAPSATGDF